MDEADATTIGALVQGIVHEVRNPLFALTATLDAFEQRFGGDGRAYVDVMRAELKRVGDVMGDVHEYGTPLGARRAASATTLLEPLLDSLCKAAVARDVVVTSRLAAELPLVSVDAARLSGALGRLFDYALERTPSGGSVRVQGHAAAGGLTLVVIDSGPVLSAAELRDAFVPFALRRGGRWSLDLAIVARVCAGHGGQVSIANQSSDGVRFTVELPGP